MQKVRAWIPTLSIAFILSLAVFGGPKIAQQFAYAVAKGQNSAARQELADLSKQDGMSKLFVQVAKVLKPAVVEIRVSKKLRVGPSPDMDDLFRRFFGNQDPFGGRGRSPAPSPREYLQRGLGSGVIVDAKNGYIVTNYHVVAQADETQVVLADGRVLKSVWVRFDPQTDLAIVKVDAPGLIDAPLGDSDAMEVGDWVLAIGSPEGLQQTVTSGIISAKGRTTGDLNAYQNFLQTDAAINHGNSGGPLVNMKGEVIGINSAIISRTGVNEGIGFAIPSSMVKTVMAQLIDKGKVTRGFLGVTIQNVDEKLAKSFKLPDTKGALVSAVTPDAPAAKAKLQEGDFIVTVDGTKVNNTNELRNTVAGVGPGKTIKVEFYRDGKKQEADVKVDNQPANMMAAMGGGPAGGGEAEAASKYGLKVTAVTDDLAQQFGYKKAPKGVMIAEVEPGSPADDQGLKAGMVIVAVQGKEVTTPEEFSAAVSGKEHADGVRIRVTDPAGGSRFVFLTPEKPTPKEK